MKNVSKKKIFIMSILYIQLIFLMHIGFKSINVYIENKKLSFSYSKLNELEQIAVAINAFQNKEKGILSENLFIEELMESDYFTQEASSMIGNYAYDSKLEKISYKEEVNCSDFEELNEKIYTALNNRLFCNNNKISIYVN